MTVSIFLGLVLFAVLTVLALLASLILASVTTEVLKTLQVRLLGAVTKAAGKNAIWLRLIITVCSTLLLYLIYFSVFNQVSPMFLFEAVAGGQRTLWFIPYVWPGMMLSTFMSNLWIESVGFSLATAALIMGVFFVAIYTNTRFGLYELPALRLSHGTYTPKTSLFGKLGFSSTETALMKKDFKTITRRPEISAILILPIMMFASISISTLIGVQTNGPTPMAGYFILFAIIVLGPSLLIASRVGSILPGLEGRSMWYLFASPISAKMFSKPKIFLTIILSLATALVCGVIGGVMFRPTPLTIVVILLETVFLIVAGSVVSVAIGIKGADFQRDFPHCLKRRESWVHALLFFAVCFAVVAPIIPYGLSIFAMYAPVSILSGLVLLPEYYVYLGLFASGIIATGISHVFCRVAEDSAEQILTTTIGPI
ncbi:hypothetical protein [Candidatus Bathycorpusculum sp.]|uniref:putative ABC transporter permease subunit n=1 Tax=Candidatus Bathycorpusculum sp. TaxID=2994959 RepID=UPI0028318779|nr:hypothetical protein [Candidatus Termitimicrobium sp.]